MKKCRNWKRYLLGCYDNDFCVFHITLIIGESLHRARHSFCKSMCLENRHVSASQIRTHESTILLSCLLKFFTNFCDFLVLILPTLLYNPSYSWTIDGIQRKIAILIFLSDSSIAECFVRRPSSGYLEYD